VAAALGYPYRALPQEAGHALGSRTYDVLAELVPRRCGVRMRIGRELFLQQAADPWWRDACPRSTG
jgi:D-amino-acid oxidase